MDQRKRFEKYRTFIELNRGRKEGRKGREGFLLSRVSGVRCLGTELSLERRLAKFGTRKVEEGGIEDDPIS